MGADRDTELSDMKFVMVILRVSNISADDPSDRTIFMVLLTGILHAQRSHTIPQTANCFPTQISPCVFSQC